MLGIPLSNSWVFDFLCVSCSVMPDSVIPRTVTHQAPLSAEVSRPEYWSGLPFPSHGELPNPGMEAGSPALQTDSSPFEPRGKLTSCTDPLTSFIFSIYRCFSFGSTPWETSSAMPSHLSPSLHSYYHIQDFQETVLALDCLSAATFPSVRSPQSSELWQPGRRQPHASTRQLRFLP